MEFSIDYRLIAKRGKKVVSVLRAGQACFAELASDNRISDAVAGVGLSPKDIRYVHFKPRSRVSERAALLWLDTVLKDLEFCKSVPPQTALSILNRGTIVDGAKISGIKMVSFLSLVRYLDEEPKVVQVFERLLGFPGMDSLTAFVLSHCVRYNTKQEVWELCSNVTNTAHVCLTGELSEDTFNEVWGKVWNKKIKLNPWTKDRDYTGVHKFLCPEGNRYIDVNYWKTNKVRGPLPDKDFAEILNKVVYVDRTKFYG